MTTNIDLRDIEPVTLSAVAVFATDIIIAGKNGKPLLTIKPDGTVEAETIEAAAEAGREFARHLRDHVPAMRDYEESLADKRRLTKELDVAIFGDGGATGPALCDVLGSVRRECRERGVPHLMAAFDAQRRSEGAFRMGARAMQQAVLDHFAALVERRGKQGPATTEIIKAAAITVADVPLPALPEQPPRPLPDWQWWSGNNDEYYTNGPCATREEAIEELCGEGGFIVEAVKHGVHLNAAALLERDYFENEDLFSGKHGEPERKGGADQIATADDELQTLLDSWVARWAHTFVEPEMFAAVRNGEAISGEPFSGRGESAA